MFNVDLRRITSRVRLSPRPIDRLVGLSHSEASQENPSRLAGTRLGVGHVALRGMVLCALLLAQGACTKSAMPTGLGLHLAPATLGESVSLQQHLRVEKIGCDGDGCVHDFDAALEIDGERLDLVVLALGQRVIGIHDDGTKVTVWRHGMLPKEVQPQFILDDIYLMLWPADVLRGALPKGWSIEDHGFCRRVLRGGTVMVEMTYEDTLRWRGRVTLSHLRYGYRLIVDSVAAE